MTNEEYVILASKLDKLIEMGEAKKEILNADEVARMLGVTKQTVLSMTSHREIPYYRPEGRRLIYFKRSEIEKWMLSTRIMTKDELDTEASTYCATH